MQGQPTHDTRLIPLRQRNGTIRAYAIVDAADYEWLARWRWSLSAQGYAVRADLDDGKRRMVLMHRQIQGDHENRNRLDYRRTNLRIAERGGKDNAQNKQSHAGSSSQYRGVSWDKRNRKWRAIARLDGRNFHLGRFDDEAEAAAVASAWRAAHMPFSEEARAA